MSGCRSRLVQLFHILLFNAFPSVCGSALVWSGSDDVTQVMKRQVCVVVCVLISVLPHACVTRHSSHICCRTIPSVASHQHCMKALHQSQAAMHGSTSGDPASLCGHNSDTTLVLCLVTVCPTTLPHYHSGGGGGGCTILLLYEYNSLVTAVLCV